MKGALEPVQVVFVLNKHRVTEAEGFSLSGLEVSWVHLHVLQHA
jgi:hypothetical protein